MTHLPCLIPTIKRQPRLQHQSAILSQENNLNSLSPFISSILPSPSTISQLPNHALPLPSQQRERDFRNGQGSSNPGARGSDPSQKIHNLPIQRLQPRFRPGLLRPTYRTSQAHDQRQGQNPTHEHHRRRHRCKRRFHPRVSPKWPSQRRKCLPSVNDDPVHGTEQSLGAG